MVRCLGVLFALLMLLSGCVQEIVEPTAPKEHINQPDNEATGLYVPDSTVERVTDGAVRGFRLEGGYYSCAMLCDELILMRKAGEEGTFALYRGENLEEVRTVSLGKNVAPVLSQMQISERGIGYFDAENQDVVFLNRDLVETGRMHLPADLQGDAWLSPDWQTVYYCTDMGIHAMNLQTGISRLLKEQNAFYQQITGGFGNGEVLRYELEISEGKKQTQLIDAETGLALQKGDYLNALITEKEQYFLNQMDRGLRQLRFGDGEDHQILWPAEENAQPQMLFANQAVVMVQREESGISLAYYDLQTGTRTAAITLGDVSEACSLQGDGKKGVWLLVTEDSGAQWLYHWDTGKSATGDEMDYTAPRYTREEPDNEGLTQVAQKATEVGSKFGVDVLVWKEAAATAPADQFFTEEYVTQLYDLYLSRLEQTLSIFPEGFFKQFSVGKLQIALVRKIEGEPAWGTLAETNCVQFLNGKTPVVAVTMDEDFERNLYHGVYLAMEARILSKSAALYEWFRLNPSDFNYDNNYITNLERTDTKYTEGENRYFIDLFSMSYAKEDRAQIFEYACMPDNEEYFQAPVIQEKLRRICMGIREAYGLKKEETVFLWEQYMT